MRIVSNCGFINLSWILSVFLLLFSGGCGNFFEKKATEIETRQILRELEQVKEAPGKENTLPELYRSPPQVVKTPKGLKLFYFTKQHPVIDLAKLVNEQLGNKTSISPATNQLIINCKDEKDADKVLEFLSVTDVPPIQVNIDCIVLERFADVTMDWETSIFIEDLFDTGIEMGDPENPVFPGASLRESRRSTFGLDIGYLDISDGKTFKAAVDMLVSRGYLKILMNPQLETVNGKVAEIKSRENAPIEKIVTGKDFEPYNLTDYQWVEDSLKVTPYVYADGSIGLETEVKIGSRSKPEGVVQQSIITERSARLVENRIAPGDSLVIGGIRKTELRSVIRGVPFLRDLPLMGILFSSKDYEEKGTEIIFILTPTISDNGIDNKIITEDIRKKFQPPKYKPGLEEMITEPFTGGIYTEHVEKKAAEAEYQRMTAEIERSQAEEEISLLREELIHETEKTQAQTQRAIKAEQQAAQAQKKLIEANKKYQQEHKKALEALKKAQKAQQEAQKLKQQAQQKAKIAEQAQAEKAKVQAEAEKAKQQAIKKAKQAQAEAEKLQKLADERAEQAKKAQQERAQALKTAEQLKKQAEKVKNGQKTQPKPAEDTNSPPAKEAKDPNNQ